MSFLATLGQTMQYEYGTYGDTLQTQSGVSSDAAAAALVVMMGFAIIGGLIGYVIHALLLGRIFKKAGIEQWKAWVPVYNAWVMLEMGEQKGWWALLMLIPFVNVVALVFFIIAEYNIGLKFGKEGVFVLLAIFLPIVWLIWLAFDKSTWNGARPAPAVANTAPATPQGEVSATTTPEETQPPKTPPMA